MVLLGKISSGIHLSETTMCSKRNSQRERKTTRTHFFHHGHPVCIYTFCYIHSVSRVRLSNLTEHYKTNGPIPRSHGNSKKLPSNTINMEQVKSAVQFIVNFAEDHGINLPGRTPYTKDYDVKLLPTHVTKSSVYQHFESISKARLAIWHPPMAITNIMSYTTFCRILNSLVAFIKTMLPKSDLCWTCQQNIGKLQRTHNESDEAKLQALEEINEHLRVAGEERNYYKSLCAISIPDAPGFRSNPPCSYEGPAHYSFDFAQQIHYPADPLQPGPIYFKTPRKCGIFRVHSECINQQMNYLIDESCSPGKGADYVISLIHHFF